MENIDHTEPIKKKRGRKKKVDTVETISVSLDGTTTSTPPSPVIDTTSENVPKKRGRKPKGGKLVVKETDNHPQTQQMPNIILHLKCSLSELNTHNEHATNVLNNPLEYNPTVPPSIATFNGDGDTKYTPYDDTVTPDVNAIIVKPAYDDKPDIHVSNITCSKCNSSVTSDELPTVNDNDDTDDVNMKDVNAKLKQLKIQLYKSSNPDKKSACFWCTYEYDNPTCYIPKYELNDELTGYGSFCRPECAVAFLMKENIDDTTKFERYHLINQLYGRTYGYSKNIKPAPDPHYLLDKFYGNLTIQEYRKLLKTEHMLLIVEKPMTRILPELHDDMEDFGSNIYDGKNSQNNNNSGVYKVKRQSEKQKGPSKTEIMKESFGF